MKRVLILEPYYGGSHRLFLNGLQHTVAVDFTLLTLPARKWKMRMQFSAFWFVQEIKKMVEEQRVFDTVLCSTFVDVAVLRSLLWAVPGWNPNARINTYFHENQFVYPGQIKDPTIRQFTAINLNTAMASDFCAFNSHYNRETFLGAIQVGLKRATDMKFLDCVDEIRKKSVVLYPGMDYSSIDGQETIQKEENDGIPIIAWNHRWEHDKGPELFFEALYRLQEKRIQFRLIVLGESFANKPPCFEEARQRLTKEIVHFGYAESREQYADLLHQADLIISTARHEFFGISILEGIRAGCYPLLPADLSYPELYDEEFLYEPGKLAHRLTEFLASPVILEKEKNRVLTDRFDWYQCKDQYMEWLFGNNEETVRE
jgi:glycosyltransferase involved in cell wall biosynthesis